MQFCKHYREKYPTCRPLYFYYFMKLFAVGVDPKSTVLINNFFIKRGQLVHFLLPHISYFHLLAIIIQQSICDATLFTCIEWDLCTWTNLQNEILPLVKYIHVFAYVPRSGKILNDGIILLISRLIYCKNSPLILVQISYAQYINSFSILCKETMMSYDLGLMLKLVCILKKKSIAPKKYLTTKKLYNSWDLSNMYKNRCIISHLIFILFHSLRKEIIEYWLSFLYVYLQIIYH